MLRTLGKQKDFTVAHLGTAVSEQEPNAKLSIDKDTQNGNEIIRTKNCSAHKVQGG